QVATLSEIDHAIDVLTKAFEQGSIDAYDYTDLLEKAKRAKIGEIRSRADGDWQKVTYRKWSKVGKAKFSYRGADNLTPEEKQIENRLGKNIVNSCDNAVLRYEADFRKERNTETARELSADYRGNRGRYSAAVHEPASAFIKELYKQK